MRTTLQDLHYALRQLRNSPGFAITAILTLALGIGATTAMLGIVDSVLLRPLEYRHAERLMSLHASSDNNPDAGFTWTDYDHLQPALKSFEALAAYNTLPAPVTTAEASEVLLQVQVTPNLFAMLGVTPRLGHAFTAADRGSDIAVVSDIFWRNHLQADPAAIGKPIKVGSRQVTLVGVLPAGFRFPESLDDAIYTVVQLNADSEDKNGFSGCDVIGSLRPGVTQGAAGAELAAAGPHLPQKPYEQAKHLRLVPYQQTVTGDQRPALFALLAGCALLLLIGCVNGASLQIARATAREGEIAMRSALGASRARIWRQIVTESLLVSALGGVVGFAMALLAVRLVRLSYGKQFPRFDQVSISIAVFAACFLLTAIAGVLAALAPALRLSRTAPALALSRSAGGTGRVSRSSRLTTILPALEVALTCTLLIAGGLFLRTFRALQSVPLGFDPHPVTSIVLMPQNSDRAPAEEAAVYQQFLDRASHLPGVQAAGLATSVPFSSFQMGLRSDFTIPGHPKTAGEQTSLSAVSGGYFTAMQIPVLQGRNLNESDRAGSPLAVIANETFVRRFLPGLHPVGTQLDFGKELQLGGPLTIVGVAGDTMQGGDLTGTTPPMLYISYLQAPALKPMAHFMLGIAPSFVVRSPLPLDAIAPQLREAIKQAAPGFAIMNITSMQGDLAKSLESRRLALRLAMGFGSVALLLAMIGVYGVLAYSVAMRVREIGIRMALGSSRRRALLLILRQAATICGSGLALGFLVAFATSRSIQSLLYGVPPQDPLTFIGVALLTALACGAAALVPAMRAASIDPMKALRAE